MQSNDKKAARFISAINAEAEQQCKKIIKETDSFIDSELKKTRAAARAKAKVTAKAELSKLDEQSNSDSYKLRTQQMTQIISKRNEITNGIFEKAEKRIVDFTKSDAYLPFLKESVKRIVSAIGADTVIYIRPSDASYSAELSTLCAGVETDDSIILGGCKGVSKSSSMRADDTIDARLNEQKIKFYTESGLSITG
ncbi:MAG: V-type ATP synthase subunit E [Acutalibacteraceae bacterium]